MYKILGLSVAVALMGSPAFAQGSSGSVTKFSGATGDLRVARDGAISFPSEGAALEAGDIVRAMKEGEVTITFNGCTYDVPAGVDVVLNADFCTTIAATETPTAAELAAAEIEATGTTAATTAGAGNAPLIVGGVLLAAGGVAAAAGGGGGDSTPTSP